MPIVDFKGRRIEVDTHGYIVNMDDWSKELAEHLANREGIIMSAAHWEVVNLLREYYQKYEVAPMMKFLARDLARIMGPEKGSIKYLYELYPDGPARQACKIAGLPTPAGCI